MKRSPLPPRTAPLPRSAIKRKPRPAAEKRRIYGPSERIRFVQALPCFYCGAGPCDNAHTVNGGKGRKANADTIIPLCRTHHRDYDAYREPFHKSGAWRDLAKRYAARVEAWWLEQTFHALHTTDPLCATCGASFREDGDQCASCAYPPCDSDC